MQPYCTHPSSHLQGQKVSKLGFAFYRKANPLTRLSLLSGRIPSIGVSIRKNPYCRQEREKTMAKKIMLIVLSGFLAMATTGSSSAAPAATLQQIIEAAKKEGKVSCMLKS